MTADPGLDDPHPSAFAELRPATPLPLVTSRDGR